MEIRNVSVIGGGLMGRQIALNTAIYPFNVTLYDNNSDMREAVKQWVQEYLAGRVAKGRMTQEQVDGINSRFQVVDTLEDAVKDSDLVIEAVVEREDVKNSLFTQVCQFTRPEAIIATNSSAMPSSRFKNSVTDPSRLANLHYFNPALVMKLTEVVRGEHTSDETAKALYDFSIATGKKPIMVNKEIDGFIVNRVLGAINRESRWLVEEGYCSYQDLDIACENGLNHPMGPFRLNDLTGIDLSYDMMKATYDRTGTKPIGFDQIKALYDKGWYGKKSGRGFYDYSK